MQTKWFAFNLKLKYFNCRVFSVILSIWNWLPVKRCIQFKLALLVYKSLHGSMPRYLSDDCQLVSDVGRRRLRSSDVSTCMWSLVLRRVSVTELSKSLDLKSGTVYRPHCGSQDITIFQFKRLLKTHMFADTAVHWWLSVFNCAVYKFLYIHTYIKSLKS